MNTWNNLPTNTKMATITGVVTFVCIWLFPCLPQRFAPSCILTGMLAGVACLMYLMEE